MRSILMLMTGIFTLTILPALVSAQELDKKCLDNVRQICGKARANSCFGNEANWKKVLPECQGEVQTLFELVNEAEVEMNRTVPLASWGGKVRGGPGMNHKQTGSLKEGAPVDIEETTTVMMNGYPWFKISYIDQASGNYHIGYQWGGILCAFGNTKGVHKKCPSNWSNKANPPVKKAVITEDAIAPIHGNSDEDNAMLEAEAGKTINACLKRENKAGRDGAACINLYADDCLQREGNHTTMAMRRCLQREFEAWDKLLNADYKSLMASLDTDAKKTRLRDAQRLWNKFVKSFCPLSFEFNGGTMYLLTGDRCMMEMTAQQDLSLKRLAASPEGQ
mgnify:CR=1 FL=1